MYSLLRILLYLNPLKLFFRNGERRNLRIAGVVLAGLAAAFPTLMPDWLATIVSRVTGTQIERLPGAIPSGSRTAPPFSAGQPGSASSERGGRGELFAKFADLRLRPDQFNRYPDSPAPLLQPPANVRWLRIGRVVDGDTLSVSGENVRLIGIDAPESRESDHLFRELRRIGANNRQQDMQWLGTESTRFLQAAVGLRCWLEYDANQRDQYGRILAYIHLDNGTVLNEAILYQGYAKVYLGENFRYIKRYIQLQNEAQRRGQGLWGAK